MKKIKVMNFGTKDSDGDVFFKENIIIPEKEVYIIKNFDTDKVLGRCHLYIEDDGIYIMITRLRANDGKDFKVKVNGLYPAVGFTTKKGDKSKISIDQIGFCDSKNLDPTIEKISI